MTVAVPDLIGHQRPRIFWAPDGARSSAAAEVIDLMSSIGVDLDPWQRWLLHEGLAERESGDWLAFEVAELISRQNGKGGVLEPVALGALYLFGDRLTGWSAHEFKTCREGFLRVRAHIDGSDDLRRKVKTVRTSHGEEGIELLDGSRLLFLARSTGSGRGFTGDRLILDEAQHLGFNALGAILPTMSARPNPQVWYAATAPNIDTAPCEVLHRLRKRALAKSDPGLVYAEWSIDPHTEFCGIACTQHDDPAEPESWARANPALGIRIRPEHVAREHAAMDADTFGRERLGVGNWPVDEDEWQVIGEEDWSRLAAPKASMDDPVCFAVDISPAASWAAIGVAGISDDVNTLTEITRGDAGMDHRRSAAWLIPRMVELQDRWKPLGWVLDPAGPAGSLIPELEALGWKVILPGQEVKGPDRKRPLIVKPSARDVAAACGLFRRMAVDSRVLRHTAQPALAAALAGAITRPLGDAWAWDRKGSGVDITPLVACTLGCWGLAVRGHLRTTRPGPFALR